MTVTQKAMRKRITASGFVNPLTHDVYLESSAHLKVYADAVLLTLGVDYSVTETLNPTGYEVDIVIPAPGAEPSWWGPDFFILSVEPPVEQANDVSLGGTYGGRFEDALDALTRRVQSIYDAVQRSIKMPKTTVVGTDLQIPTPVANWVIGFDADGDQLQLFPVSAEALAAPISAQIVAAGAATLDDADLIGVVDVSASNTLYKRTWTQVKAFLKTYFDTLYATIANPAFTGAATITNTAAGNALTVTSTDAGAGAGPIIEVFRNSASPAVADIIGQIKFLGKDGAGNNQNYGEYTVQIADPTSGSEDSIAYEATAIAGTYDIRRYLGAGQYMAGATSGDMGAGTINAVGYYLNGVSIFTSPTINNSMVLSHTDDSAASGPNFVFRRISASPAANDVLGLIGFDGRDSNGNNATFAQVYTIIVDPTDGGEDGLIRFATNINNSLGARFDMAAGFFKAGAGDPGSGCFAGDGFRFPAVHVASADGNMLDDYEEGTFTPVVVGTSAAGVGTYGFQTGSYVKIGRRVFFDIAVSWSAHTGTGNLRITGLPFTSDAGWNYVIDAAVENLTFANRLQVYVPQSTTQIDFFTVATGAAPASLAIDAVATLYITGSYRASS